MKRIRCALAVFVLLGLLAVAAQIRVNRVTHEIIIALEQAHACAV